MVMTYGLVPPVVAVCFDATPGLDSGFLVVFSDAPPPADVLEESEVAWMCMHCVIDEWPEVGVALDLARSQGLQSDSRIGEVWLDDDGGWSPLEGEGEA